MDVWTLIWVRYGKKMIPVWTKPQRRIDHRIYYPKKQLTTVFGYVSVLVNSTSACVKRKHVEALTELIVVCDVKLTIKYAIISHLMMLTQHCFTCGFQSKYLFYSCRYKKSTWNTTDWSLMSETEAMWCIYTDGTCF